MIREYFALLIIRPVIISAVTGYPGTTTTVIPPGQPGANTTVVVRDDPYYRRRYDGTDVAMGVVAGAAIGSMMWGPVLWW